MMVHQWWIINVKVCKEPQILNKEWAISKETTGTWFIDKDHESNQQRLDWQDQEFHKIQNQQQGDYSGFIIFGFRSHRTPQQTLSRTQNRLYNIQ